MERGQDAVAATGDAFRRLSPRHKQCLRLAYDRRVTKEIAAELNLGVGTVNGYCTEAIAILGARNRRDAAEMLHAHEAAVAGAGGTPFKVQPQSEGVFERGQAAAAMPAEPAFDPRALLPLRRKGARHNDLGILLRLAWIPLLAILFAVGFGMLATGLRVTSDLIRALRS
ncbi:helix-turn-helix domain-containing protein [Sphingomonas corticis]|jgi:DNA-binding CsgD family transcriptional regulator|nr:helix-turn-helix transcriptional regulator [Sphingomonas corticis]